MDIPFESPAVSLCKQQEIYFGIKAERFSMKILISNTSNLAIYEQIIRQIKDGIIAKEIQAGEMLPSIRSLAKDLQISVITTKRAYEELEKEGLTV